MQKIDFFAEETQVSSGLILLLIHRSLCAPLEKTFIVLKIYMSMIVTQLFSLSSVEFWLIKTLFKLGSRAAKQQQKTGFPVSRLHFSFSITSNLELRFLQTLYAFKVQNTNFKTHSILYDLV